MQCNHNSKPKSMKSICTELKETLYWQYVSAYHHKMWYTGHRRRKKGIGCVSHCGWTRTSITVSSLSTQLVWSLSSSLSVWMAVCPRMMMLTMDGSHSLLRSVSSAIKPTKVVLSGLAMEMEMYISFCSVPIPPSRPPVHPLSCMHGHCCCFWACNGIDGWGPAALNGGVSCLWPNACRQSVGR